MARFGFEISSSHNWDLEKPKLYTSQAKRITVQGSDTTVLNMVCHKGQMPTEAWSGMCKAPQEGARRWMRHVAKVPQAVDVFHPKRTAERPDMLTLKLRVQTAAVDEYVEQSGSDGVSIWEFGSSDQVILLPAGTTLASAHRQAARLSNHRG